MATEPKKIDDKRKREVLVVALSALRHSYRRLIERNKENFMLASTYRTLEQEAAEVQDSL